MKSLRTGSNGRYNADYGIRDVYKMYVEDQLSKGKEPVDRKIFSSIIYEFNESTCDAIINNALEYRLPFRLGYIRIRKHKTRIIVDANGKLLTDHLKPDWVATKKLWSVNDEAKANKKIVFHSNTHSQRYYYKWYWDRTTCNVVNSSVYKLIMTRTNKRKIAHAIKNNEDIDFYE